MLRLQCFQSNLFQFLFYLNQAINKGGIACGVSQDAPVYRLFDEKRLNPQPSHLLSDLNEQKNRRYGFSRATKQAQNNYLWRHLQ
jgi:hypothetical protein